MKKVFLFIALLFISLNVKAQSSSVESRLDSLMNVVSKLQADLEGCKSTINQVVQQNLALKHAISLQPTLAEYTTDEGINFRLLKAEGDKQKGEIQLCMSV